MAVKYLKIPKLTPKNLRNFWKKVDKRDSNTCWPWLANQSKRGYGKIGFGGKHYRATRVMLAITGQQNNQLEVRHSCNNPNCVNPSHLCFGTHIENEQDKILAGTILKGSQQPRSKLIEADIPIIRKLSETRSQRKLGLLFGVDHAVIGRIRQGKTWRHILRVATDKEVKRFLQHKDKCGK